jgi:hypothetical protein
MSNAHSALCLKFARNPQTGLPRLVVVQGTLPERAAREIEDEIRAEYEELARRPDGSAVMLRDRRFRLSVAQRETRLPELTLEQEAAAPLPGTPSGPAAAPRSWAEGWLASLGDLREPAGDPLDPHAAGDWAVDFALQELQALAQSESAMLAGMLLAGYLVLGEHLCRESSPERAQLYQMALANLQRRLAGQFAANGELAGLGKAAEAGPRTDSPGPLSQLWQHLRQVFRWPR